MYTATQCIHTRSSVCEHMALVQEAAAIMCEMVIQNFVWISVSYRQQCMQRIWLQLARSSVCCDTDRWAKQLLLLVMRFQHGSWCKTSLISLFSSSSALPHSCARSLSVSIHLLVGYRTFKRSEHAAIWALHWSHQGKMETKTHAEN